MTCQVLAIGQKHPPCRLSLVCWAKRNVSAVIFSSFPGPTELFYVSAIIFLPVPHLVDSVVAGTSDFCRACNCSVQYELLCELVCVYLLRVTSVNFALGFVLVPPDFASLESVLVSSVYLEGGLAALRDQTIQPATLKYINRHAVAVLLGFTETPPPAPVHFIDVRRVDEHVVFGTIEGSRILNGNYHDSTKFSCIWALNDCIASKLKNLSEFTIV